MQECINILYEEIFVCSRIPGLSKQVSTFCMSNKMFIINYLHLRKQCKCFRIQHVISIIFLAAPERRSKKSTGKMEKFGNNNDQNI